VAVMAVVVARVTPRIPIARRSGRDPDLSISEVCWERIENGYGHKLPPEVRDRISGATYRLVFFAETEQRGAPVSAVRERIESIKTAAEGFRDVQSPAARYADHLINLNLDNRHKLHWHSMVIGCDRALSYLDDPKNQGRRKGDTWRAWVRGLISILKKENLPTEVRKDTDKNKTGKADKTDKASDKTDKPSDFVIFVRELQKCIPPEYQRSTHSDGALAVEIDRARRPATAS
jgi:hypothetical protein